MKLPNSGIVVSYSTKYCKFLDEDIPAVMPDKRIDPNWMDYKAGREAAERPAFSCGARAALNLDAIFELERRLIAAHLQ